MDVNTNAFRIVRGLTERQEGDDKRSKTARSAGKIGGRARAGKLSAEKRREIAEMGSNARWKELRP